MDLTPDDAKAAARRLRDSLAADDLTISHSHALDIVARQLGHADWNTASAALGAARATAGNTTDHTRDSTAPGVATGRGASGIAVPILRMYDVAASGEFYLDYLGFTVEWDHRFAPDLPLYRRIRRAATVIDLSEHHGDGTPGSVVWIPIADADAFHAELSSRPHPRLRPGIETEAPGGPTIEIIDPSGNILRFCQASG